MPTSIRRRVIKSGLAPVPKLSYGYNSWCGGRAVECGGLLNRCTGKTVPGVRIPPAPVLFLSECRLDEARPWVRKVKDVQAHLLRQICAKANSSNTISHRV